MVGYYGTYRKDETGCHRGDVSKVDMHPRFRLLAPAVLLAAGSAHAQRYTDPDTLAPAFPTPQAGVEHRLETADLKAGETLYDLGCGDGRIVITAAQKFHAKAVGV